ncbi:MAG: putative bifunctional diguanylate cyclase/phosphodiesterase [Methylophilus sp.]|uniref:putative bifunctional diguanylate cyclase/phosphodiesterase n=1 Tax=Methylophilus sp. TaxID=29541 RepID=UPI003FA0A2A6
MLSAQYELHLVTVSILIAVFASYTALDLANRMYAARGKLLYLWWFGGSFALGFGIWSMHFTGMLSFDLPIPLGYDIKLTLVSLLIAILAAAFALNRVSQKELTRLDLITSSIGIGISIAGMHYMGMAALKMSPEIQYNIPRVLLSIGIAILASFAAMWITFKLQRSSNVNIRILKICAAIVMGFAIAGMHYTGMSAADFPVGSVCTAANSDFSFNNVWLVEFVIVITFLVLVTALLTSLMDARYESETNVLLRSLARVNKELSESALKDRLTSLANRELFENQLELYLSRAEREENKFALLFIDLDGFKLVNDSLGHIIGDLLLKAAASRLKNGMRAQDTVARLGGDEFVALIEIDEPEDAGVVAAKINALMSTVFIINKHEIQISASIGVAIYPENGTSAHDLVLSADTAMYGAKSNGKNGCQFFESTTNTRVKSQLELVQKLKRALSNQEFYLNYQPKFDAKTRKLVGIEALIRWKDPEDGLIGPDIFIPIAEKNGLIIKIGEWVLDEACRQISAWTERGYHDFTIAVNLSAVQFRSAALVETVRSALKKHNIDPKRLVLEVTESTAVSDFHEGLNILHKLVELGVSISIDDFGVGYSSLMYLKELPAIELKIDRGFIANLNAEEGVDAAIVISIISLGQSLSLRVVAEGVETERQCIFLTEQGCDHLQGYFLGRPMSAADVETELKNHLGTTEDVKT